MSQEEVILKKGWAEFSQAHHLCNTDKLIFTCGCHGCFSVLIFDKNGMLVEKRLGPSEVEGGNLIIFFTMKRPFSLSSIPTISYNHIMVTKDQAQNK